LEMNIPGVGGVARGEKKNVQGKWPGKGICLFSFLWVWGGGGVAFFLGYEVATFVITLNVIIPDYLYLR